jgi:dipeptidyl-peptidase 4
LQLLHSKSLNCQMKKIIFLLFISTQLFAQPKNFTMKEAVLGMGTTFAVENLKQLKWMGASDYFAYSISNENAKAFIRTNANTNKTDTFIHLTELNSLLSKPLTALPAIDWQSENSFIIQDEQTYLLVTKNKKVFEKKVLAMQTEGAESGTLQPVQQNSVAYLLKDNLFLFANFASGKEVRQITTDGSANIVYGKAVHRDEFGITDGLFWSPKGNALAFYRMDQTMVEDYPIIDWVTTTPATAKTVKYPFAGRTSHQVTLGVYDVKSDKTIYLQTGEPNDQYLTTVTWSPDELFIYVSILNRDQNYLKLNKYDAKSGALVQTLFEEKNDKYVEPQHQLEFFNNDPTQFIWWSQRDGYMHLYHYNANGTLINQLTNGNWVVNEFLGYNAKSNEIIFSSSRDNPMQKNVFAVNIQTFKLRSLSNVMATHTASVSKNATFILDSYTSKSIPRNIDLVNVKSGTSQSLLMAKPTLSEYKLSIVEDVNLKTSNGFDLYAKIMKPSDFDANIKYPVIVYLYNGPHIQLNKDTYPYSGNLWYDYLTQHGYIVFVLDGRGSANRGFEFESAIHRKLGELEMEDQMQGISYLKSLPYVNAKRMGIHGWSYGGFMTTSFMLRKPDVFKCGVAGGPVLDWSMYEIMYGERYMDTPQQNPDGYAANLLIDKVKNLKGKLLMIHGTDDATVVWQHSMKFIKQAVSDGVPVDYFVYPGYEHNVRGKDRVHLMQKITDYFDLYLKN